MIPGDPLLHARRPLCLPGRRWRNPVPRTTMHLVAWLLVALSALWVAIWLTDDPFPDCLILPDASFPALDYRDGVWVFEGHVIGTSPTEDSTCIRPV